MNKTKQVIIDGVKYVPATESLPGYNKIANTLAAFWDANNNGCLNIEHKNLDEIYIDFTDMPSEYSKTLTEIMDKITENCIQKRP